MGFGIVMLALPFYAEELGASATLLGGILSIYAAAQFLFAPLWGKLSDRYGRRPVILFCVAGMGASLLWLGLAETLPAIFVARFVAGDFA
ncbi:MAG: MFS transporter, partial [Erythrobacter sp.]|nr:MFS transporter [Erythrobacter sp.]